MIYLPLLKETAPRVFLLIVFFCLLFLPSVALGIGQTESISRLEVDIVVNKDGSVQIDQDISFISDSNYLYWIIPSKEIDNIEIKKQGKIIFPTDVRKENDQTVIFWRSLSSDYSYLSSQTASLSYSLPSGVDFHRDRELVQVVVLRELGQAIKQAQVTISYPKTSKEVKQRFYAIHGIEKAELISSQGSSFSYRLTDLSPYAIFSTNLSFPKGSLSIPLGTRIKIFFASLSLETVLLISLLIPMVVYLLLFSLYRNHLYTKDLKEVKGSSSQPPDSLSPALIEVLLKNQLTSKGIGALILRLLTKNYLTIIDREEKTFIGKIKEPDQGLTELEKMVIKILFRQKELHGGLAEIKRKKSKTLFDQMTDRLYQRIDYLINREYFFVGDSNRIKGKILRQGIGIFSLAILLAIFSLLLVPSSPWLALAPISLVVASLMIIRMRAAFTIRSPRGQNELVEWLKFRNYLAQPYPIEKADQKTFEENLVWAYLFGNIDQWLEKFTRYPLSRPKWFVSSRYGLTTEDWTKKTINLIDRLSEEISGLKSPGR